MTLSLQVLAALAALAFLCGLLLVLSGRRLRVRQGLGPGRTLSLDKVTLVSHRLGLCGRVDRLIQRGGDIIPEEWKSSRHLRPHHRAQMGVYFLLIEEQYRRRPAYGIIVLGDGTRQRIDNTEELQAWVLELAARIRAARAGVTEPIPVQPQPGQCRACAMRSHCTQARL